MNLKNVQVGIEYIIKEITTNDDELDAFLFSLGCYVGEPITVISQTTSNRVVKSRRCRAYTCRAYPICWLPRSE